MAAAFATSTLSEHPTEAELRQARIFPEMLVPVGGASPDQNRRLAATLKRHTGRGVADDYSALEQFLAADAASPWAGALWANLGSEYYNTGWYSKALGAWEKAWPLLKEATEPAAKALGDHAAGELASMYGRLGRMVELAALLESVEGRVFIGSATEKISGARRGLWTMRNRPEIAFKCGPYALEQILVQQRSTNAGSRILHEAASTTNGLSLSEVAALSRQVGMNYQRAFRPPGAALVLPAVVNWKLGHYAALVKEENGLYLVQDPTFGNDTWMSRRALEAEVSGYFLVPPGKLPAGWRSVSEDEGQGVFGKGVTSDGDAPSTTPADKKTPDCPGAGSSSSGAGGAGAGAAGAAGAGGMGAGGGMPPGYYYAQGLASNPYNVGFGSLGLMGPMARPSVHLMLVSLNLMDVPVGYQPPVGPPVWFVATYNQREAGQPAIFNYSNLGPKWTFNWLAYIKDNPSSPSANVDFFTDGGGTLPFTGFDTNTQTYLPQVKSQAQLKRTSTNSYEMLFLNGSKIIFDLPGSVGGTSRRVFARQLVDPAGNAVQIGYDGSFRVVTVTDAIGQVTTFEYTHATDTYKITKVTDPFGRFASFSYDTTNRLAQITDAIGITSQFTYDSGDFVQVLTTPYGTTTFEKGESGRTRWLVTTHPNGEQESVEYNESAANGVSVVDPAATVPAGMGVANNYLNYRNSFYWDRKAHAEGAGDFSKARLYHWVHFGSLAGGVLESMRAPLENRVWLTYDGQSTTYSYGTTDKPNAIGRVLDDGTTQLYQFGYDALGHITNAVDPAGRSRTYLYSTNLVDLLEVRQTTGGINDLLAKFLYNTQHLAVATWDAAGQLTTNTYNARGQLLTTINPRGESWMFVYDANGYLRAVDGPLPGTNDSAAFMYDAVGRVQTVTGSDGYTVAYAYDNLDRVTNVAFPDGTFAAFTYDKLDRVKARDRQGRETQFTYDSLRRLTSVRDPMNRTMQFDYCGCGGLATLIDPLGRATRFDYDLQGRITGRQYADGSRTLITYESATSRPKSVRDERGQIAQYEYTVDDSLRRVSYPVAAIATPAVNLAYDSKYHRVTSMQDGIGTTTLTYHPAGSLGALQVAALDGPWANDTVTHQYDELGRLVNRAINGVPQARSFDPLGRMTNAVNALGSFNFNYDGPTARLLDVSYPNGQTAQYDYFGAAGDHRLQGITHRRPDTSVFARFTYGRNPVGNVTNWLQELAGVTNAWSLVYDAADQLLGVAVSQATTNFNHAYTYDALGNRLVENIAGTNRVFQYNALNQLAYSSDATATNATYEWDAEQRLVAVNRGTNRTELGYDGVGRCVRIVEKQNGVATQERRFVWCGFEISEERDATGANTLKRFFPRGVQLTTGAPGNYFHTRDHLGSLRALTDSGGAIRARYDYDPFGQRTKLGGDLDSDWGVTGHFFHEPTALSLAPYRSYNAAAGRWLSRDPLGEYEGPNLYAYVGNNPANFTDPLGLKVFNWGGGADLHLLGGGQVSGGIVYDKENHLLGFKLCGGAGLGAGAKIYGEHTVETGNLTAGLSGTVGIESSAGGGLGIGGKVSGALQREWAPQKDPCTGKAGVLPSLESQGQAVVSGGMVGTLGLSAGLDIKGCITFAW